MSSRDKEHYEFEIPEEGLDYDILDMAFNPTTRSFIEMNGIQSGMRVLDVGSGSGVMTHYLAKRVGQEGHVLSIDNSLEQLQRAERYCQQQGAGNVTFKQLSLYELESLNETFDLIYCRFVLHHLYSPRLAIRLFYQALNPGGIYLAEEGIVSSAFAYPPSRAWQGSRGDLLLPPEEETDGIQRDGEFGMKLFYWMKKSGFAIQAIKLIQPVLTTDEQKKKVLDGHIAFKKTALQQGKDEAEWAEERQALMDLANDDLAILAFYQSCQVCGVK